MNLLTVKAAALRAGVSPALVYDWVASGELPHLRVGAAGRRGHIRVDEADLLAFLQARKTAQPARPEPPARRGFRHIRLPGQ